MFYKFNKKFRKEMWVITQKKLTKEQKEIEGFISWLKIFYKSKEKDKNLILLELIKKDFNLYKWLNSIKDINKEAQERLYEQLRIGLYKDEVGV